MISRHHGENRESRYRRMGFKRFPRSILQLCARVCECLNTGDHRDINLERALTGSVKIISMSRGDHRDRLVEISLARK
jgi:hypothetical protein